MQQLVTQAIILARTDYGEADRILTLFTPDHGKVRLLAKGVRRVKSKLAGGIELFSISNITFIKGRSELGTLVSTRLVKHYGKIVANLERTMLGYELIKQFNKITEDEADEQYFTLLEQTFEALDDSDVAPALIRLWFSAQLLRLGGHTPNLRTDTLGAKLQASASYAFNFEAMCFTPVEGKGTFTADHIKFLRLLFDGHPPSVLSQVRGSGAFVAACELLVQTIARTYL